ncbi:hypothetical protein I317_02918 [Kwoniella heveanensis CBS 569]|nr:hypothetical protein I317_02918 [Kwoniella heveanensis CBS 569]
MSTDASANSSPGPAGIEIPLVLAQDPVFRGLGGLSPFLDPRRLPSVPPASALESVRAYISFRAHAQPQPSAALVAAACELESALIEARRGNDETILGILTRIEQRMTRMEQRIETGFEAVETRFGALEDAAAKLNQKIDQHGWRRDEYEARAGPSTRANQLRHQGKQHWLPVPSHLSGQTVPVGLEKPNKSITDIKNLSPAHFIRWRELYGIGELADDFDSRQ